MILADGTGIAIAMGIGGVVCVLLVSGVFYAIGRGEDRDRAAASVPPPGKDPQGDVADSRATGTCPAEESPPTGRARPRLSSRRRRRRP